MRVKIEIHRDGKTTVKDYDYARRETDEKPMILDVLLQAQATNIPATTSWLDEFNPSRCDGNITLAIAEAGGKYWGPDHLELTEPEVRKAQQYGLEVHPWTANTTEHIHRLCGWRVDAR